MKYPLVSSGLFIKGQRTSRCLWGCQQGCPLSPLILKSALSTRGGLLNHHMSSGASLAQKKPKNGDENRNQWADWELILLKRHPKSPTLRTCLAFLHGLPGMLDAMVPQTCRDGAAKRNPLAYLRKFPRTAMGWGCGTPPNDQLEAI